MERVSEMLEQGTDNLFEQKKKEAYNSFSRHSSFKSEQLSPVQIVNRFTIHQE